MSPTRSISSSPSSSLCYPRSHSSRPSSLAVVPLLVVLLLLAPLLARVTLCRCDSSGSRVQHNVWYSGLFISGIAVDEASGDVFFSDAAGNRVVHQSANGTLLDVWQYGFYSPMQLAYNNETRTLYVADSTNNRVGWIDVTSGGMTWAPPPTALTSCNAVALSPIGQQLFVVDGWGLLLQPFDLRTNSWRETVSLFTNQRYPLRYASSVTTNPLEHSSFPWLADTLANNLYIAPATSAMRLFDVSDTPGVSAIQQWWSVEPHVACYTLSQPAADQPMTITQRNYTGAILSQMRTPARGRAGIPFYGWAMYVDSRRNMYVSSHGVDAVSSPYGRVVKLSPAGTELGAWSMNDSTTYSFSPVIVYDDVGSTSGGSVRDMG